MKLGFLIASFFCLEALEFEPQLENESVKIARVKVEPHEEIGLHRDAYPQVVVALKGGVMLRLESDGSIKEVSFPTGTAVFREMDPPDELHKSVNPGDAPIELIIIQLKK
jgi:quercetin dioxygenase-like cupin family protein